MKKSIIVFLMSLPSLAALAQDDYDCVFDQETQTDEFVRDVPEFADYTWNDTTKEATILLEAGDTLIAQRGGCVHFGISGTLVTNTSKELANLEFWFEKGLWIAKRLFNEVDYEPIARSIAEKTYTVSDYGDMTYISFPHEYYSEFSLTLRRRDDKTELYIGYYFG